MYDLSVPTARKRLKLMSKFGDVPSIVIYVHEGPTEPGVLMVRKL